MSLTPLEQASLSYFVAGPAGDLVIATRWYPYGELILIIEDKFAVATRKFGLKAKGTAKVAGTAFLDAMIAAGAWETKQNDFGGAMHQFQMDVYRKALAEMRAEDALAVEAAAGGEGFWAEKFGALAA